MTLKTLFAATALIVVPSFALAMGCSSGHQMDQQAMSCAEGTMWDAATGTCIPLISTS